MGEDNEPLANDCETPSLLNVLARRDMKAKDSIRVRFSLGDEGWWTAQATHPKALTCCITQGKTLKTARKRLREALSLEWESERRALAAELVEEFLISPSKKTAFLSELRKAREESERAAALWQSLARKAAKTMTSAGVSTRDAGDILGLSQSRVAQLVSSEADS